MQNVIFTFWKMLWNKTVYLCYIFNTALSLLYGKYSTFVSLIHTQSTYNISLPWLVRDMYVARYLIQINLA